MVNTGSTFLPNSKIEDLFEYLEHGKQIEFFNLWESIVPLAIKNRSTFKHLTFYVHVYFIVQKLKSLQNGETFESDVVDPLDTFKNYLWNNGSYFSTDVEFVPYFVLPFVHDLDRNKMFSNLLQDAWATDFKNRLRTFITENRHSHEQTQIETILCDDTKYDFVHWKTQYNDINKKFNSLYQDNEILTGILRELISVIRKYVLGEDVDLRLILDNCYKLNPSLFNENPLQDIESTNESANLIDTIPICDLNFEKIKSDLLHSSIKTKLLILQALRWGITRNDANESSSFVWLIINYDILLMNDDSNFIRSMLVPSNVHTPHPTQQTVARLINAIASSKLGQNYLASCETVQLFIITLKNMEFVEIDDVTVNMLVATLEKLSWIHCLGELMINQNLIEWLVQKISILEEWNYLVKYILRLLISLTRYRTGQQNCLDLAPQLVEFSKKFLRGGYKSSENCESIFWKFCAFLENIHSKPNITLEHWQASHYNFHSANTDILREYFQVSKVQTSNFEEEINADDPLKVEPNGIAFLRLNYSK